MTKHEQIASMVQTLAETYRVQLTAPAARAYIMTLEGLSPDELRESGRRALKECEHMPAPAVLLRLGLKARKDGQLGDVERTNLRLEAMQPSRPPTPQELEEMRHDWKKYIAELAESKS